MRELEERILRDGKVLPGNILKVGSFLNQQLDVPFMMRMGREIADAYRGQDVTKILTVEASGIALAVAAAAVMELPVVFAKKNKSSNVSGDVYTAPVHSYTHNKDFTIVVSADYIKNTDRLLIVDDFLANGEALRGLLSIAGQAGAEVAGCAVAIEKGFQGGGDALRAEGVRVDSLAIVEQMSDTGLTFRN